jgi:EmrB/QacA subfamily drug resistance transporter
MEDAPVKGRAGASGEGAGRRELRADDGRTPLVGAGPSAVSPAGGALAGVAHKWWLLLAVMVGTFMGPFDGSVVNISLPTLTEHFRVDVTTVEWVVVAYLLTVSTLLLTFGRLGDVVGLRKVCLSGYVVFVMGSLACALAWNIWALIAFRALQALGAGMVFAVGPALITRGFPASERGRALGFIGVSVAAGLAIGPTLGGVIIDLLDWRWIFLVNLPVGLFAIVLGRLVIPRDAPRAQRFDPLGAVLSLLGLFPLLLALSEGEQWGWTSIPTLGLLALGLASLSAFVIVELRIPHPVLDLSLFRDRLFSTATASAVASYVVTATIMFIMPFYLLRVQGLAAGEAGLLLTPVPAMTAIVGPLSGALSDRIGSRLLSTTGLVVTAVGVGSLAWLDQDTGHLGVIIRLLLVGIGMGLFQSPNSSAIMGSVPRSRLGIASGMVATARNTGMVFGVALAGMVLAVRQPHYLAEVGVELGPAEAGREALLQSIQDAVLLAAGICLLGAVASLNRGGRPALRGEAAEPGSRGEVSAEGRV